MMGIAEFLDAPDSALLIAIDGDVNLVTTHHESETRTIIDRFPLGPVANVDAVLALLGFAQGEAEQLPDAPAAALPAPEPPGRPVLTDTRKKPRYACPDCGGAYRYPSDLKRHRATCRGVARPPSSPVSCEQCGKTFQNSHALNVHKSRSHGGSTWSTRAKAKKPQDSPEQAAPAVAARVTQPAPEEPDPVSLDVTSPAAPPVTPRPEGTRPAAVADGICPVCFKPLVSHDECDVCSTLIGPGHTTERPIFMTGLDLCHDCARSQHRTRRDELAVHAS